MTVVIGKEIIKLALGTAMVAAVLWLISAPLGAGFALVTVLALCGPLVEAAGEWWYRRRRVVRKRQKAREWAERRRQSWLDLKLAYDIRRFSQLLRAARQRSRERAAERAAASVEADQNDAAACCGAYGYLPAGFDTLGRQPATPGQQQASVDHLTLARGAAGLATAAAAPGHRRGKLFPVFVKQYEDPDTTKAVFMGVDVAAPDGERCIVRYADGRVTEMPTAYARITHKAEPGGLASGPAICLPGAGQVTRHPDGSAEVAPNSAAYGSFDR